MTTKKASVLIIEDNGMTRDMLGLLLEQRGFEVAGSAVDGEQGLILAKELRPDIVCLDLLLPRMPGLEVLRRIKALLPSTIVIVISGTDARAEVDMAMNEGAIGFVTKPFHYSSLETLLNQYKSAA